MFRPRRKGTVHVSHLLAAGAIACLPFAFAGCEKKPMQVAPLDVAANAPTRGAIVAAHNERVGKLRTTNSDGVIELRWSDEQGNHSEQGDIELWQTTGDRTALDISKIGERLLWMGSSGEQWWLFDLMRKDDRVLYVGSRDALGERFGALGVKPLALLDLLGLSPIEPSEADAQAVGVDAESKAWTLQTQGRGGRLRIAFDQATLLPKRIELLDDLGAVVATSTLSRYESVEVPGLAVMARPKMPLTIDIRRELAADGDMTGGVAGNAKIALNATVGEIKEKAASQIFDLERLTAAMRPDRIERMQQVASP